MNLLLFSTLCSKSMIEKVLRIDPKAYGIQGQKFFRLIARGLSETSNTKLTVVSRVSVRKLLYKRFFCPSEEEIGTDNIHYHYLADASIFSQLVSLINAIQFGIKWLRRNFNGIILCDGLNFSMVIASFILKRIKKETKVITVLTDMPRFLYRTGVLKHITPLWESILRMSDGFVVLTDKMNLDLNKNNKPFVVIDGLVDPSEINQHKTITNNHCLYTGFLKKIYGIENLIKAFIPLRETGYELHLYGNGDFADSITSYTKLYPHIKYHGTLSNEEIIRIQRKAALLINPRPSEDEYTEFSFPSKTLEYMMSGTPVLTTHLKCIGEEYDNLLYFFDKEDISSMTDKIKEILDLPVSERNAKGEEAMSYIRNSKTYPIQITKLVNLINKII